MHNNHHYCTFTLTLLLTWRFSADFLLTVGIIMLTTNKQVTTLTTYQWKNKAVILACQVSTSNEDTANHFATHTSATVGNQLPTKDFYIAWLSKTKTREHIHAARHVTSTIFNFTQFDLRRVLLRYHQTGCPCTLLN